MIYFESKYCKFSSKMSHYHRTQLDITRFAGPTFSIPKQMPGRILSDDFVFFSWAQSINPADYWVAISSNDTSGPIFRKIAPLDRQVELPYVHIDAYGMLVVLPATNENLPRFIARLSRGSTYVIPDVKGKPGTYQMGRHGVLTSGVATSNLV